MKLVGVMVTQDLRWQRNTDYICGKARAKLWILRRLLEFNLDIKTLFDIYCKEIRNGSPCLAFRPYKETKYGN